jgi:hypothetical protein
MAPDSTATKIEYSDSRHRQDADATTFLQKEITMSADLTHEEFSKHLHTKFRVRLSDTETIEAELTRVSEHMVSPQQERFSIFFRAPNEPFLGQGLRSLEHEQMGPFDLFLVPLGRDEQGTDYEAVFNRMLKK